MITTDAARPVIVVGGGIGGMAAALALARKGHTIRLLEQAREFGEIGAGIQLGPNVFRMFERLGITEPIADLAVYPEALVMRDSVSGDEVTRVDLGAAFRDRFGHPYALIHRADLHRALMELCRDTDRISFETGWKVTSAETVGDGVVLTTEKGERVEGAAVIGADGLWSTLREQIVGDGRPHVSGHIAYRAVLPTSEVPEELRWQSMVVWAGEKTHLVQYPLRGGELFNLVAVFHSSRFTEGWDSYGDAAELHERFAGACAPVKTLLGKIDAWRMWVLCDREPARNWSNGRVTLLGDAAHPMMQYMAQGACMAVEDAVCLADTVEACDDDFAEAFVRYEQERYLRTARVQMTARLYGEVFHASGALRDLRNTVLGQRTQAQAYDSMQWLYGVP